MSRYNSGVNLLVYQLDPTRLAEVQILMHNGAFSTWTAVHTFFQCTLVYSQGHKFYRLLLLHSASAINDQLLSILRLATPPRFVRQQVIRAVLIARPESLRWNDIDIISGISNSETQWPRNRRRGAADFIRPRCIAALKVQIIMRRPTQRSYLGDRPGRPQ